MSKNDKTAIKLLSKYAEGYSRLEEENKILHTEIKDLKKNLKINKEIIEDFYKSTQTSDSNSTYINKLKEEISHLQSTLELSTKEKEEFRKKLNYLEAVNNEALSKEKEDNEKLQYRLLVLENQLSKTESILAINKKKVDSLYDREGYRLGIEKEIFVIEPTQAVNKLHNELLLYKNVYENLSNVIDDSKDNLQKYIRIVNEQQAEIIKLKEKLKGINIKKDSDDIYSNVARKKNVQESYFNKNLNKLEPKDTTSTNNQRCVTEIKRVPNYQSIFTVPTEDIKVIKVTEVDEWVEIRRMLNISKDEMERLSKNKMLSKLMEAIEMMNRLISDKNFTIKLMEKEYSELNQKNSDLNNENIKLMKKNNEVYNLYHELKSKYDEILENNKQYPNYNKDTQDIKKFQKNSSKITINNLNINSISSISKIYENKKNELKSKNYETTEGNLDTENSQGNHFQTCGNANSKYKSKDKEARRKEIQSILEKNVVNFNEFQTKSDHNKKIPSRDNSNHELDENNYNNIDSNLNSIHNKTLNKYRDMNSKGNSLNQNKSCSKIIQNKRECNVFIMPISENKDEDLNESIINSKRNNKQISTDFKKNSELTMESFAPSDVRKNFDNQNESGFISNANDLENFSVKITTKN